MEIEPIQESQLQKLQGLEQLDRIKAVPEDTIPTDVVLDILKATAEIGIDQIVEAIKVNSKNNPQVGEVTPTTFNEMLNTTTGNFLQRIAKAYIKPRNPRRTIKLMKVLQVDKFLKIVKYCFTDGKGGSNYSLADSSLNSMVDFATNSTTFNEGVHLSLATLATALVLPSIIVGHVDPPLLGLNLGTFLVNTYCVLRTKV